jgi:UDP-glucuronate decarboxylase
MKKRVLVTGGAGFIGSHLCARLLSEGNEVLCVDNFFTGTRQNVFHLLDNPYFEIIRHDITFPLYVEADEIYNLACPASPVHYTFDPVQTIKISVLGALNMLGLARRLKIKILQASTSEIYGDPQIHPQLETYLGNVNPIGPRACYSEGKRCVEALFFDYKRQFNLQIKVARLFNVYGPRMRPEDGRVISNFIIQALTGKDITVNGDGSQTRSFCYIEDVIDGIMKMMSSNIEISGPINIGNPAEISILNLAKKIIYLTDPRVKIIFKPLPEDDPRQRCPNIRQAKEILGWQATTDFETGLKTTIAYFYNFLKNQE